MEALEHQLTGKSLHDSDLVAWATSSAAKLRQGEELNSEEREQIAEELWLMAGSTRRELKSRTITLLIHLLKCEFQPEKRTRSWLLTISQQRQQIREVLVESPSLRSLFERELPNLYARAREDAQTETGLDTFPEENPFTLNQILNG